MLSAVWGLQSPSNGGGEDIENLEIMLKDKIRLRIHGNESEEGALLKVFKFIDIDENGFLTPPEFKEALSRMGVALTDNQLKTFYLKYDVDRSGTLDYGEFCRAVSNRENYMFSTSVTHSFFAK